MRLAFTTRFGHDDELIFAQQLGADAVVVRLELGSPSDTDLAPVAHRVRVAGLQLAGMPQQSVQWSDSLDRALVAAEDAGVDTLLCAPPTQASVNLSDQLSSVVATASATGVKVLLDSARLLPEHLDLLPAGNVQVELAIDGATAADDVAAGVRSGSVAALRFEGEGRPLGEAAVDVPQVLAAADDAGFDGWLRAGASAPLSDDDDWRPKGAANDLGYLRAIVQSLGSPAR